MEIIFGYTDNFCLKPALPIDLSIVYRGRTQFNLWQGGFCIELIGENHKLLTKPAPTNVTFITSNGIINFTNFPMKT